MTIEDRLFDAEFDPTPTSSPAVGAPFSSPASGVTVHYTASSDVPGTVRELVARSLGYHLIIDRDGTLYRMASFGMKLAHAGIATWRGESPNARHLAIAVVSLGFLDANGRAFEGSVVPPFMRMLRAGNVDKTPRLWHVANTSQEKRLTDVLVWFVQHGMPAENICGHDECALPLGRKSDPGGVLSWPMQELRSLVAVMAGNVARPERA